MQAKVDEGHLTNVRTAAAGAVVAKHLAPKKVECIGIFGTGGQARMQLQYLKPYTACNRVMVWGRNEDGCLRYKSDMEKEDYDVSISLNPEEIGQSCNFIVMADVLVGDSLDQCKSRGEIFKAMTVGAISPSKAVELGDVISEKVSGRTSESQLTIADLTGVAIQDIQISVSVLTALNQNH